MRGGLRLSAHFISITTFMGSADTAAICAATHDPAAFAYKYNGNSRTFKEVWYEKFFPVHRI